MSPDPGRPFTVEPWHVREPRLEMSTLGQAESVFALSNGHIGLRGNLDEGEPHATARHLPQLVLREAAAAVRRGRLRLPRVRPDDHQRHQRQADPPARRRRAVRPALRASCATTSACSTCATGTLTPRGGVGLARGPRVRVRTSRIVSLTQRAIAAIRYEVELLDAPALLVVQSELVANEQLPSRDEADPRVAAALPDPLISEQHGATPTAPGSSTGRRQSGLRVAAAMDHEVEGPEKLKYTSDGDRGPRAARRSSPGWSRARRCAIVKYLAYGWSARRSQPALHDQVGPRWPPPASPAGTACSPSSASTSTRSGPSRTSRSTATPSCSRRSAWRPSTCCRPVRAPSGGRSGRRASPARATTATRSGTPRRSAFPCCRSWPPRRRPTRCAGARRSCRWRYERAEQLGLRGRGVPVADDPRARVLGLLARGHGRVPHQRRHRRRRPAPRARPPATADSSARSGSSCSCDRAAVALAGPPRLRPAASASTASPGPTSTPRSPTTTSTRTSWPQRNLRVAADTAAKHRRGRARARASTPRRWRAGGTPPRPMSIPFDEELGVHPQSEGFTQHQQWDFENTAARALPAAAARARTSTSTASRWSSRPTSCSRMHAAARRVHARADARATSPTTRRSRCGTRRSRRARRR